MRTSVTALESFYASRLGAAATAMVGRRLATLWPDLTGRDVLGFGYAEPFLRPYLDQAARTVLAMPGAQGALAHRGPNGIIACLTREGRLPFADASFDNIFVAHGLEHASDLSGVMRELWRVTRPEGRLVILAPNRAGLWARSDRVPFGDGRPWSRTQLRALTTEYKFQPVHWSGALFVPPVARLCRAAPTLEVAGETLWPGLGGLVLVEAVKRLYATLDAGQSEAVIARPLLGGLKPKPVPTKKEQS